MCVCLVVRCDVPAGLVNVEWFVLIFASWILLLLTASPRVSHTHTQLFETRVFSIYVSVSIHLIVSLAK
jgi:hypothetical protein